MENYNPDKPVCDNQTDFSHAYRQALRDIDKHNVKKMGNWLYVMIAIYMIFLFWAVLLALKVPSGSERTLHVLFAILAPPAYVISYYLGNMQKRDGVYFPPESSDKVL